MSGRTIRTGESSVAWTILSFCIKALVHLLAVMEPLLKRLSSGTGGKCLGVDDELTFGVTSNATSEEQVLERFFRCRQVEKGSVTLQVGVVEWEGHHPYVTWHDLAQFETPCANLTEDMQQAKLACLNDKRFFMRCECCGELNNIGHMLDPRLCQGCAERHFGIVF